MILGLFIGESFAELSVAKSTASPLLEYRRWYLPKQSLKSYLQKWISSTSFKPNRVIVASRFINKLSGHRLGGSVAQIVTAGFENWPLLTPNAQTPHLRSGVKLPSISSPEYVYPLKEKTRSNGKIEEALQISELAAIHEKLLSKGLKKVCLHFHNSEINPTHQAMTRDFLVPLGYELYEPPNEPEGFNQDPLIRWRTNTLNAAICGTFEEVKADIQAGLAEGLSPEKIFFFDSELNPNLGDKSNKLSSLFALEACLFSQISKKFSRKDLSILHLGLEHFSLISPERNLANSPWGTLSQISQTCQELITQPSCLLELSKDGLLCIKAAQSYEPGPIHLGRGHKPLVADLLINNLDWRRVLDFDEKQIRNSIDRWDLLLQTWQRASPKKFLDTNAFHNQLSLQLTRQMKTEIHSLASGPLISYGFLSPHLKLGQEEFLLNEVEYPKSFLLALEALVRGL